MFADAATIRTLSAKAKKTTPRNKSLTFALQEGVNVATRSTRINTSIMPTSNSLGFMCGAVKNAAMIESIEQEVTIFGAGDNTNNAIQRVAETTEIVLYVSNDNILSISFNTPKLPTSCHMSARM